MRCSGARSASAYSRDYCANGKTQAERIASCKKRLVKTLTAAIAVPRSELYPTGRQLLHR